MAIIVKDLNKQYHYYKKQAGLAQSVKNLFHREKLVKEAVRNISFSIDEGEIVGFLGPNGAGKTTTLKMLSGILFPTGGSASVLGFTPWERKKEFKKRFAIVLGQKSQLWPDLPAYESFQLNKAIYEVDDRTFSATLDELVELLDVKELLHVQARRLSLGERMKMELIASLIHRPRILFLDEPTIGLDVISQKKIREFIRKYNERFKITVLLTSHYMKDIEELCRRTIVINEGQVMFDGDLNRIKTSFADIKRLKVQFAEEVDVERLRSFGKVTEWDGVHATIETNHQDVPAVSQQLLNRFPVLDFAVEEQPIDEAVAKLFAKGG
nr:ATP-binding cassette domain-containing protein [Cohnella sp. CFH 77786]